MSDIQFKQYEIIVIFAEKWRKYKPKKNKLTKIEFRKEMQLNKYVKMDYINPENSRNIIIYLFASDSKHANASQELRKLMSKNKEPADVLLITEVPFKIYSRDVVKSFKHLNIKCYLHQNFNSIVPEGPLCYPHRIMSKDEVNKLLNNDLYCNLTNLPKILEEDPQCIWIGAVVGDVVEIKNMGDINGEFIQHRVVIPKSGKIISFREDEKQEAPEEEDDIKDYRDEAKNDLSDYEEDDIEAEIDPDASSELQYE
jgi:DNA-directed RNA polymerase subunit H (RpoH/RPB5)